MNAKLLYYRLVHCYTRTRLFSAFTCAYYFIKTEGVDILICDDNLYLYIIDCFC